MEACKAALTLQTALNNSQILRIVAILIHFVHYTSDILYSYVQYLFDTPKRTGRFFKITKTDII